MKIISIPILKFLIIFLLMSMPFLASAQIGDSCDYTDPFAECPIDGGLVFLLVAGIGIRAKKSVK